jgi:membrane fusion protein, multidrug efflux system
MNAAAGTTADFGNGRNRVRMLLLWGLPLVLACAGAYYWFVHRFEVSTDNAYVRSEKTLVAPQIDGQVTRVFVVEN